MIAQLKTEIKFIRKTLTLIILISAYTLFITIGLILKDAFIAIFIGMTIPFVFFVISNIALSSKIDKKYKDKIPEDTKIYIEKSYSIKSIALYMLLHAIIVAVLFCIAEFDALALYMAIFSLFFIGVPILSINCTLEGEIFKPRPNARNHINGEHNWSTSDDISSSRSDTWHSDPCMPGNPIYPNH